MLTKSIHFYGEHLSYHEITDSFSIYTRSIKMQYIPILLFIYNLHLHHTITIIPLLLFSFGKQFILAFDLIYYVFFYVFRLLWISSEFISSFDKAHMFSGIIIIFLFAFQCLLLCANDFI